LKENRIGVYLVDDHSLFRECLKDGFKNKDSNIRIAGEAKTGKGLLQEIRKNACDIILLDIIMPDYDSLDLLKALKKEFPKLPVLILSSHCEIKFGPRYLKAGANGYFCKKNSLGELIFNIKKVLNGELAISSDLTEIMIMENLGTHSLTGHTALTDREFQVMCLMGSGVKLAEVARRLCLSPKTISAHRCRIMEKMEWENNAEMMFYAIENHLVY